MPFLNIFSKKDNNEENNENPFQKLMVENKEDINGDKIKDISDSVNNLNKSLRDFGEKISKLSENVQSINDLVSKHEEDINNIKNSIEKIIGLYDIISKQYNPFIEDYNIKKHGDNEDSLGSDNNQTMPEGGEENKNMDEHNNDMVNQNYNIDTRNYEKYIPLDSFSEDPIFITIVIGWLSYIVKLSNLEEAKKALDYYEYIGWITEDVKIKLQRYLYGLNIQNTQNKKLDINDHLLSLYIIMRLKKALKDGINYNLRDLYNDLITKGIISD